MTRILINVTGATRRGSFLGLSNLQLGTFEWEDLDQIIAIEKASFPDPYPRIVFAWFKLRVGEGFIVARKPCHRRQRGSWSSHSIKIGGDGGACRYGVP